jgi:hypothetical protein
VTIFNKRNALVGFLTLKALERRRQRKNRQTWKIATFVALGIVSAGVLAAVIAVALRRQKEEAGEERRLEGYAVGDNGVSPDSSELDSAVAEPGFAE